MDEVKTEKQCSTDNGVMEGMQIQLLVHPTVMAVSSYGDNPDQY